MINKKSTHGFPHYDSWSSGSYHLLQHKQGKCTLKHVPRFLSLSFNFAEVVVEIDLNLDFEVINQF